MRCCIRALSYFREDWKLISAFLALVAVSIGVGVMQAWPMAVLVDVVLNPLSAHTSWPDRLFLFALPRTRLAQIIGVTLIGMCMKILQDSLGAIKILSSKKVTYNGRLRLRRELYAKLQKLSPAYHRMLPQGDAIYRVLNDTVGGDQILNVLLNSLIAAVTLMAMIGIMLSRNVPLTLFAVSVAPLLLLNNNFFGKRIKRASIAMKQVDTRLTTSVQHGMSSIGLIQAFNRQRSDLVQFGGVNEASAVTNYALDFYNALFGFVTCTIYSLGGAVIFGYGAYLVYRDQFAHPIPAGVTCGDLMVFMAYLGSLWDPLRTLASTRADLQTGIAGAERVFAVLDQRTEIDDPATPVHPFPVRLRTLALRDVTFEYREDASVLRGVTATILPGDMVAFVGPSGAGKSTLLQLMPRFADVTGGSVELDGVDVRRLRLADLRRHIAIVPQENTLLPTTILDNILYGRPDASEEEVRVAAEMAGAHQFIAALPAGYATRVGEEGQNLSGGQRQRLAVARALLSQAPILVLDEPTSALDPNGARQIMDTLHRLRRKRTIILVTHDVASVAGCDQIFVLQAGQVIERGMHDELLTARGAYTSLLELAVSRSESDPYFPRAA
jgi:subfamily B ATP-binding cassette protein MsbA